MTIETVAGTSIAICASAPATFNAAGYAALPWTDIGEVTDLGTFGRVYNLVKHNPIKTRGTKKVKGSFDEGKIDLQYGVDDDDSGQTLVEVAVNDDDPVSIRIISQSGIVFYFQALVMSAPKNFGGVDNVLSCTATMELTTADDGTGIVKA
jgi:hypothetical protein